MDDVVARCVDLRKSPLENPPFCETTAVIRRGQEVVTSKPANVSIDTGGSHETGCG